MLHSASLSLLTFGTIVIVLLIGAGLLFQIRRKRSNRHPMEHQRERNIDEMRRGVPPER